MRFTAVLIFILLGLSHASMWGDAVSGAMKAAKKLKENAPSTKAIREKANKGAAAVSHAGAAAAQAVAENTPAAVIDGAMKAAKKLKENAPSTKAIREKVIDGLGAAHGAATQAAQAVAENAPAALGAAHGAALSVAENAPAMGAALNEVANVVSGHAVKIGNAVYNNTRDNIEAGAKAVGAAAQKLGDAAYAAANATLEASLRAIDAALQATFGIGLKDVPGLIKSGSVHASNFGYFAFVCLSFGMSIYLGLGIYPAIFVNVMVVALGIWRSARVIWYLTWKAYVHMLQFESRGRLARMHSLYTAHIPQRARRCLAIFALPLHRVPLCGAYPGTFVLLTTVLSFVLQWLLRRLLSIGGVVGSVSAARYHDLAGPNTRKLASMMGDDGLAATPLALLEQVDLQTIRVALQEQAAALEEQAGVMSTLADKFAAVEKARAQLNIATFEAEKKEQKDADLKFMKKGQKDADCMSTKKEQKDAESMSTKKEQ